MTEKTRYKKRSEKIASNDFLKKTIIQSAISAIICVLMLLTVKIGGKEAGFNVFVRRFLFESTDFKQVATSVFNKVNTIIDSEIVPVINNIGVKND